MTRSFLAPLFAGARLAAMAATATDDDAKEETIKKDRDKTRKMCFAPPGKDRPTGFRSASGSEHVLVTFERDRAKERGPGR
ncbi:MAG TPA: hypothetical protein VM597_00610 [Gemmataceae bacterium]|jgi:hypothetical protein|nr:hypothetical protein [Gemmataceae bacterium]